MPHAPPTRGNLDFSLSFMRPLEETDSFLVNYILKITEKEILSLEQIISLNLIHIYLLLLFKCRKRSFSSIFEKRFL